MVGAAALVQFWIVFVLTPDLAEISSWVNPDWVILSFSLV
jgi:hypothetical protein